MGGFGSGRWQRGKETTDDYQSLDIRELQRNKYLKPGHEFSWQIQHKTGITEKIKMLVEVDMVTLFYKYKSDKND